MAASTETRAPRLAAALREGERVTPLELFFDLVFVLAITQCTALMAHHPTWSGLAQGLLVLGMLWWAWVGYAWLTSVIDPEEGAVRLVIFGAMAALLIVSLCVPGGLRQPRRSPSPSPTASCASPTSPSSCSPAPTTTRCATRCSASPPAPRSRSACWSRPRFFDGLAQGALWALALFLDMGGPYFFGSEGWKLVPGHFAERHGLIVIIALGESIVAIGVGAAGMLDLGDRGRGGARGRAGRGDVVDLLRRRRPGRRRGAWREAEDGREQNEMARDSYSYMHLPMVAGIVLVALGLKTTIGHVDDHLHAVPAFALLGGRRRLPARASRLPLPPRPHDQPPAPAARDRAADPGPGGDRAARRWSPWRSSTC